MAVLALACGTCQAAAAEDAARTVHIRGSLVFMPIMQRIAEDYMRSIPGSAVVISGGGTTRGYLALLDGTADVAMVSGSPSDEVADVIRRTGIALTNIPFRHVAMAPAVHFTNPVNDLSMAQLREIFSGRISNWKSVGGKDAPIKVFVGPPSDGITNTWSDLVMGEFDTFTPSASALELEQRIVGVGRDPNAITYLATVSLKDRALKLLSVDTVLAGADSAHTGRYTLLAPLMLVTRGKPGPATQKFLQYVQELKMLALSNAVFTLPSKP